MVVVAVDKLVVVGYRLELDVPFDDYMFHNNLFVVVVVMRVECLKLEVLFELFLLNVGRVVVLLKLVDSAIENFDTEINYFNFLNIETKYSTLSGISSKFDCCWGNLLIFLIGVNVVEIILLYSLYGTLFGMYLNNNKKIYL